MEEIAEDMGMAKASLYYYFPTKDDLFRGIIQREQNKFICQIKELLDKEFSTSQKLRMYFHLRSDFSNQIFNLSWHNRQLWPSMKPMFKDLFENLTKQELLVLADILQQGKQTKELKVQSPKKIAQLIINVMQGLRIRLFYSNPMVQTKTIPYKEFEDEVNLFIEILLCGLRCPQGK